MLVQLTMQIAFSLRFFMISLLSFGWKKNNIYKSEEFLNWKGVKNFLKQNDKIKETLTKPM